MVRIAHKILLEGLYSFQWETADTANALQTDFNENLLKFQPTDDTVAMIQYSSGSTGKPKGYYSLDLLLIIRGDFVT